MWLSAAIVAISATGASARWRDPDGFLDGHDLNHYVTRPDLTAPRYMVAKRNPGLIAVGYWFVAPYAGLFEQPNFTGRKEHMSAQTGAHIYDNDGHLVWSGAGMYGNRNVFGFKPLEIDGESHLSFHLAGQDLGDGGNNKSANIILNDHYEEVSRIEVPSRGGLDLHEFNISPDGKFALVAANWYDGWSLAEGDIEGVEERFVVNCGFQEVDIKTGETVFEWDALGHGILLSESHDIKGREKEDQPWDFLHCNAFDKDEFGDFYVSGRHTSTVYKVSGKDGHIIWRLGGDRTDFKITGGVGFHWQHHIRVRDVNSTHTIISVFDNASDEGDRDQDMERWVSSAKIIILDTWAMTANILRRFDRPDGGSSEKLGSVQLIGEDIITAQVFVDWAYQGYLSEYHGEELVLEAKFMSDRMSSYRGYKYPFVGKPKQTPCCKILPMAYSSHNHSIASAFFVSWNGATEVKEWAFYGSASEDGDYEKLATVPKNGFETSWVMPGYVEFGYAEAIDVHGMVLGRSNVTSIHPEDMGWGFTAPDSVSADLDRKLETPFGHGYLNDDEQSKIFPVSGIADEGKSENVSTPILPETLEEPAFADDCASTQEHKSIGPTLFEIIWTVAVHILALFGLVVVIGKLIPVAARWRRGYQLLESEKRSVDSIRHRFRDGAV